MSEREQSGEAGRSSVVDQICVRSFKLALIHGRLGVTLFGVGWLSACGSADPVASADNMGVAIPSAVPSTSGPEGGAGRDDGGSPSVHVLPTSGASGFASADAAGGMGGMSPVMNTASGGTDAGPQSTGGTDDGSIAGGGLAGVGVGGSSGEGGGISTAGTGPVEIPMGVCRGASLDGQLVAAQEPVAFAAEFTTDTEGEFAQMQIATASGTTRATVAFDSSEHLATVTSDGVSIEETGVCGDVIRIRSGTDGNPVLFASTLDVPSDVEANNYFAAWTRDEPRWSPDFIVLGTCKNCGPYSGSLSGYRGRDAVVGSDGEAYGLGYGNAGFAHLFERTGPGSWEIVPGPDAPASHIFMALDSLGRKRIVHVRANGLYQEYYEWTDGMVLDAFRRDTEHHFAGAVGRDGLLAIARFTDSGIAVTYSDGASVSDDQLIPDTQGIPSSACYEDHSECEPVSCDVEGVDSNSLTLTATDDGTFWLAYRFVRTHSEYEVFGVGGIDYCWALAERTRTYDATLVRLSADGSAPPSVRARFPGTGDGRTLALEAQGSRLYLGVPDVLQAHLHVIDSEQL